MINHLRARSFSAAAAPSEHDEQVQFIRLVEVTFPPEVAALLFAIPNGGARHIKTARELKAEGVRSGVPDMFFAYPRSGYSGLFIEMKRRHGGRVSEAQTAYIEALRGKGYKVEVCKGCDEAYSELVKYLGRENKS